MDDPFRELDLFHGEATEGAAQVFARLPHLPGANPSDFKLTGELVGPFCKHATTLTARYRLTDAGPGPTLLARGLVREPSYWSPELPMLYRATIRLERAGETIAHCDRPFALRRLGARGKDLYLDGRRWVLRGMFSQSVLSEDSALPAWRDAGAAKSIFEFDPAECLAASEEGVLLARWPSRLDEGTALARECALNPAVALVALRARDEAGATALRQFAPNVLRGVQLAAHAPIVFPSWAQVALVTTSGPPPDPNLSFDVFARHTAKLSIPVVVVRPLAQPRSLVEARMAVDELQRDLAPYGDFAGYLV